MRYHKISIQGKVQGVGFRPCVFNIATKMQLKGYVKNKGNQVEILIDKDKEAFLKNLKKQLPKQAVILCIEEKIQESKKIFKDFRILDSKHTKPTMQGILPQDMKVCKDCLKDMQKLLRFKNYAFSACANCGPRYSIIKALPYDRKNTTMQNFKLCATCKQDYNNPKNRRFHAEPISCNDCKITLKFFFDNKVFEDTQALQECILQIQKGKILAIKGIGGFAIVCDSHNQEAIKKIRNFKNRPFKPFAIMAKDIAMARKYAYISKQEEKILNSTQSPIVLLKKKQNLQNIAPYLESIGIVLPYTPLHHLLFEGLDAPIVFTSANITQEPIITHKSILEEKLGKLCDGILDYTREISNPIDDSVVQVINKQMQIIRLARGYAPLHLQISQLKNSKKILVGMGAEQKITLAYRQGKQIILSPFIGDLNNPATLHYYERIYNLFGNLYKLKPYCLISDTHQNYHSYNISANKSMQNSILWEKKQHHYAHFCAIFADAMLQDSHLKAKEKVLGIVWDGSGMGENFQIWGGEFFFGNLKSYKRVGHFETMQIFGGEKSIKDIYKIGYAFAKQYAPKAIFQIFEQRYLAKYPNMPLFNHLIEKNLQSFYTTSVGRIFDGIASLCGICDENTYDAQAPMMLQALYQYNKDYGIYPYILQDGVIKMAVFFEAILQDILKQSASYIATKCINTLAFIAYDFAMQMKAEKVLFSGGVFMNKALCEQIAKLFSKHRHIKIYFHQYLPSNDSNIALGQAISME